MANFMAQRIIDGFVTYAEVTAKRPTLKPGIDAYLTTNGHADLIIAA